MTHTARILPVLILLCASLLTGCVSLVVGGVATSFLIATDPRTTGSIIEDQAIEIRAYRALSNLQLGDCCHVNVTSYNQKLLLSGEIPTAELRQRIEDEMRAVARVIKVYNETQLASPSTTLSRSNDVLLTGKIKFKLNRIEGHPDFNVNDIKIVTENGSVFVFGLITSGDAKIILDQIRRTEGAERVISLIEYQPG